MVDKQGREAQQSEGIWLYVRIDEYVRPKAPARETVRRGILGLWDKLRAGFAATESAAEQSELREVPLQLLDRVAPAFEWSEPAAALDAALADWLRVEHPEFSARVVVGPPFSGTAEVLANWAVARGWPLIESPTADQVLAGGGKWFSRLVGDAGPQFVIPALERCYLRHCDGLELVRKLLHWLSSTSNRCLIGCDSWAWAYLQKALGLGVLLPTPLVLDAFDHGRLQRWFHVLAENSGMQSVILRQSNNGKYVLPPVAPRLADSQDAAGEQAGRIRKEGGPVETTDFLKHLAAYSLGIPGVAWSAWRHSLGFSCDEPESGQALDDLGLVRGCTIYIKPWSQISLPKMSGETDRKQLFVLHTILLHGGVSEQVLLELVPNPPLDVLRTLRQCDAAGLLRCEQGAWQVTAMGYPVVRQVLESEGYLVDVI